MLISSENSTGRVFLEHMKMLSTQFLKLDFCLCKNKDTDQRLCFHSMCSTIPPLAKYKISSFFFQDCTGRYMSNLVGNPEEHLF